MASERCQTATGKAEISLSLTQEARQKELGGSRALARLQLESPALNWAPSSQRDTGKEERIHGRAAPVAQKGGEVRESNRRAWLGVQSRLGWADREEKSIPKRVSMC